MGCDGWSVLLTSDAEGDLNGILDYLVTVKLNPEAAVSLLDDFEQTIMNLERSAGSLKLDDDPRLARLGYHRIHLSRHSYFMMYRLTGDTAVVDRIFHDLQDYRNRIT